jgi:hypothetical protein
MSKTRQEQLAAQALELFDEIEALFGSSGSKCVDPLLAKERLVELRQFLEVNSGYSTKLLRTLREALVRLPKARSRIDGFWRSRLYSARISIAHDFYEPARIGNSTALT